MVLVRNVARTQSKRIDQKKIKSGFSFFSCLSIASCCVDSLKDHQTNLSGLYTIFMEANSPYRHSCTGIYTSFHLPKFVNECALFGIILILGCLQFMHPAKHSDIYIESYETYFVLLANTHTPSHTLKCHTIAYINVHIYVCMRIFWPLLIRSGQLAFGNTPSLRLVTYTPSMQNYTLIVLVTHTP